MHPFGNECARLMLRHRLTTSHVAKAIGLKPSEIWEALKGRRQATEAEFNLILPVLARTPDETSALARSFAGETVSIPVNEDPEFHAELRAALSEPNGKSYRAVTVIAKFRRIVRRVFG